MLLTTNSISHNRMLIIATLIRIKIKPYLNFKHHFSIQSLTRRISKIHMVICLNQMHFSMFLERLWAPCHMETSLRVFWEINLVLSWNHIECNLNLILKDLLLALLDLKKIHCVNHLVIWETILLANLFLQNMI